MIAYVLGVVIMTFISIPVCMLFHGDGFQE